jgi:hypothetical protein
MFCITSALRENYAQPANGGCVPVRAGSCPLAREPGIAVHAVKNDSTDQQKRLSLTDRFYTRLPASTPLPCHY